MKDKLMKCVVRQEEPMDLEISRAVHWIHHHYGHNIDEFFRETAKNGKIVTKAAPHEGSSERTR